MQMNVAELTFKHCSVEGIRWGSCIRTGSMEAPALWVANLYACYHLLLRDGVIEGTVCSCRSRRLSYWSITGCGPTVSF
eukprot:5275079-Pyramimonas_sp.AAC.1